MSRSDCWRCLAILFVALAGCDSPVPEPPSPAAPPAAIGAQFDPSNAGVIAGRVTWDGPIPTFPPVSAAVFLPSGVEYRQYPHPNAPDIDPTTPAIGGAV